MSALANQYCQLSIPSLSEAVALGGSVVTSVLTTATTNAVVAASEPPHLAVCAGARTKKVQLFPLANVRICCHKASPSMDITLWCSASGRITNVAVGNFAATRRLMSEGMTLSFVPWTVTRAHGSAALSDDVASKTAQSHLGGDASPERPTEQHHLLKRHR